MQTKAFGRMGMWCILFSALFLWNPIVGFADVLPDFFGYLLLYIGLYRMSDLNLHIEEARRRTRMLLWVGVGQLFAMWILYGTMVERAAEMNPYEQPVGILLCSFAYLFFKFYFLIPAYRELFIGLERLAEKHNCYSLADETHGKTVCQRMIGRTRWFIILSSVLSTLPEMTVLISFEYDVQNPLFSFDWYTFIDLFRTAGAVIAGIMGIVWLVRYLSCIGRALREREWILSMQEEYERDVLTQTGMLTVRSFQTFFLLLQIGIVFSVQLRMNYYSVLPGFVFAAFACVAVKLLSKRVSLRCSGIYAAGAVLTVVSLLQVLSNRWYLSHYLPEASLYQPNAYNGYLIVRCLGVAEAFFTVLLVWMLLRLLLELIFSHTAVDYEGDVTHALSNAATARLHKSFEKRCYLVLVLFLLAGIANAMDSFFLLQYSFIWLIAFVFSFFAIWNFYSLIHDFLIQLQYRFLTDSSYKKR